MPEDTEPFGGARFYRNPLDRENFKDIEIAVMRLTSKLNSFESALIRIAVADDGDNAADLIRAAQVALDQHYISYGRSHE